MNNSNIFDKFLQLYCKLLLYFRIIARLFESIIYNFIYNMLHKLYKFLQKLKLKIDTTIDNIMNMGVKDMMKIIKDKLEDLDYNIKIFTYIMNENLNEFERMMIVIIYKIKIILEWICDVLDLLFQLILLYFLEIFTTLVKDPVNVATFTVFLRIFFICLCFSFRRELYHFFFKFLKETFNKWFLSIYNLLLFLSEILTFLDKLNEKVVKIRLHLIKFFLKIIRKKILKRLKRKNTKAELCLFYFLFIVFVVIIIIKFLFI